MRNHLRARWLSARRAAAVAGVAVAAGALTACGSVAAPGAASGEGSVPGQGTLTSPAATASPAGNTSPGAAAGSGSASATAGPPAGTSAPAGAAGTAAACTTAGLKVVLDTAAEGVAAGTYFIPLEFTNTSKTACRLTGYPAVALTSGRSGQQIGPAAATDHAMTASAVLLAPGGVAHAWLQMLSTANYPASQCHPAMAAGLQVTAPGSQGARFVAHPVSACRTGVQGSALIVVHPVQLGPARRGTA